MLNHGSSALLAVSESGPLLALLVVAVGGVALVLCLQAMRRLTARRVPRKRNPDRSADSGDSTSAAGYMWGASSASAAAHPAAKAPMLPTSPDPVDTWDCNDGGSSDGGDGGGGDGGGGGGD